MRRAPLWLAVLAIAVLALGVALLSGCSSTTTTTSTTGEVTTTSEAGTTSTSGSTTPSSIDVSGATLVSPGELTVGSDTAFPPFESMNGTTAEGFDVDLMTAIADKLGLKAVIKTEVFDTLIPTLKAGGKFDIIASAMTITDERKQEIDFSDPYIDSNQSIAVKKDSTIKSEADLAGKKVGVQSGTTGEAWAKENLTDSTMVPFKTATDAFSALQAGNVEAVVNDLPVSAYLVKDESRGLMLLTEIPTAEQYGFAVAKTNTALLTAVNAALAELKQDGTYDTIYEKWFGMLPGGGSTTTSS